MNNRLLEPIKVGKLTFKNRIMFPPLTTGYEERDGSIGDRSLSFYERLAKGGTAYVVIGDVAPVRTASPTPKLYDDSQIPVYKKLADTLHAYDCKVHRLMEILMRQLSRHSLLSSLPRMRMRSFIMTCSIL